MLGILVASDARQEWILPWWWKHYSRTNAHPVAFVDLGMSKEAKAWCQQRGELLSLPMTLSVNREETPPALRKVWERCYGDQFWQSRARWFLKPLAMLQSPFHKTLWLDLDCEVRTSVEPLFFLPCEMAMALEPPYALLESASEGIILEGEALFNSGVVFFTSKEPLLLWWKRTLAEAPLFWTDQHIASRLHFEKKIHITQLPSLYNWRMAQGAHKDASIYHWVGDAGKAYIRSSL